MQVIKGAQGSEEWHDARRCKITATKLDMVMGTPLVQAQLIAELVAEYASEQTKHFKATAEMERGTEEEPKAVASFENATGTKVNRDVAFCVSDKYPYLGFSPDGFVGDSYKETIEIKNPDTKTMMFYKIANMIAKEETGLPASKQTWLGIPLDYKYQVLCSFVVNEEQEKLHFIVHDSRVLDPSQQLYTIVVERSNPEVQKELKAIEETLVLFRDKWMKWKSIILPETNLF